ncbi:MULTISPECIES: GreA/GreB family elongation factor [Bizionia]|uniref:GreA/GreB family elongation factor n=1 Tax=Bizionia algoritergicola TaxID=291187 RepID=A0A5D0QUC8_9FLAO|nr:MULTISPECIES: GreA/GreB family elongation factor [Bizionia]OBX21977.1 transcription elongation factor GreAB [Bizionia sp. APA-3]TYB72291.1 GreA/GreB family elongation factor [Bizionia algoritergicola]
MKYGSLILEKKEYVVLKRLLNLSINYKEDTRKYSVKRLETELQNAVISDEELVPQDVIRFNSVITVATDDGWENTFELVTPNDKNYQNNKVSVLTPMGSAVMGYAQGDVIDWEFPGGIKKLRIVNVKQNKSNKHYQL